MDKIIKYDKSVVIACDIRDIKELEKLVKQTCDVDRIGGYKVGITLCLKYSLPTIVNSIRKFTNLPIIYDHQKAGTDIPDLGKDFAEVCKNSGVNAVILFPQSGSATQESWIKACQEIGLAVIVGGEMTHPKYKRSEGGYISDDALDDIYLNAAKLNINNFVVPGNKIERVLHYKEILTPLTNNLTFFAPGFIAQGGVISDTGKVAGNSWHAIVGRAIYGANDIRSAAKEMTKQLSD